MNTNRQKALQSKDNRPIGVFDSGVGGLTVVKELVKALPFEDIIYYGDTARVPYGTKSTKTIIRFSIENALFLLKQNVKLIVVACNTSSSVALNALRKNFKVPVIGVIKQGAFDAVRASRNKRVGVIGTTATVKSNAYGKEISRLDPCIRVYSKACGLFVPIVEEQAADNRIILDIVRHYLLWLKNKKIDTLVLGCTHYPLLKKQIQEVMGMSTGLVDSAVSTALLAKQTLEQSGALSNKKAKGRLKFFVSDETGNFKKIGQKFLGKKINNIRKAGYGIQG
jgi:glutamate racemase